MGKGPKVLIVDDEPTNLRLISLALSKEYQVVTALNGHEAISRLKQQEIDLILLDVMMPDLSGFDVCKIIKADPRYLDIPVVFLTARTRPKGRARGSISAR